MQVLIAVLMMHVGASVAHGSGWNDFQQPLGGGYSIFRANSTDIRLALNGVALTGDDPLIAYIDSPERILTQHERGDGSFSYYIVDKLPHQVVGPLSEQAFRETAAVQSMQPLQWKEPTNPHPEVALAGQVYFLVAAIVIVGGPLFLCLLGLALTVFLLRRHGKQRPRSV